MTTISNSLVALTALSQLWCLILEMFLWQTPIGAGNFGISQEFAHASARLAANKRPVDGFLAVGLVWSLLAASFGFELKISFSVRFGRGSALRRNRQPALPLCAGGAGGPGAGDRRRARAVAFRSRTDFSGLGGSSAGHRREKGDFLRPRDRSRPASRVSGRSPLGQSRRRRRRRRAHPAPKARRPESATLRSSGGKSRSSSALPILSRSEAK